MFAPLMLPCNNERACVKESLPVVFAFFMLPCISERACATREPACCAPPICPKASKPVSTIQPLLSADDMCQVMVDAADGGYG